jgi:Tfp pilus assembly protein PilF
MVDLQSKRCTTGQFKGLIDPKLSPPNKFQVQFMRGGDWSNAILVLNKAIQIEPNNLQFQKDLALTQYYQRDFAAAKERIGKLLEREDADVQVYQIAGNIYKALDENKECEKIYKKAIKKFPESGALYAEFGELLYLQQDPDCMNQWLTGIEQDPGFASNYYYASKSRYAQGSMVWALLYGETFINLESYTKRTAEIKALITEAYKKFFSGVGNGTGNKQSPFAENVSTLLLKNQSVIASGITTESLIMLRTRFLLDWRQEMSVKYPYRLMDHHLQLLQDGLFEAYNYWIFEAASNLNAYESWMKANATAYQNFSRFQKSRVFKVPAGQHYLK